VIVAPLRGAPHWFDYWEAKGEAPRGAGTLLVHPPVGAPGIGPRTLLVYLPAGYGETRRRYPLVVLHDGQNLFDDATSFAGSWRAHEAFDGLAEEGLPAIALGVPNAERRRIDEYSPWRDTKLGGGLGEAYLDYLEASALPLVAASFRVERDPAATAILGASMGGLISLYAYFTRPGRFGSAGAMSPSLFFAGGALFDLARRARRPRLPSGRIYLDVGTGEGRRARRAARRPPKSASGAMRRLRRLAAILARRGYIRGESLLVLEEAGGEHDEAAWAGRLPGALRFLLGGGAEQGEGGR